MSSRKRRATSPKTKKAPTPSPGTASDLASPEEPCAIRDIFKVTTQKNGHQYLLEDSFPCFARDDLWNILLELGFLYRQGFRNPAWWGVRTFDHEDELRQFMVKNGIPPNTHAELEEKEHRDALKRWIAFAFVPLKTNEAPPILEKVAVPTDYQALSSLLQLGFKIDASTGKISRAPGEEEFNSIQELRNYVRAADSETLLSAVTKEEATPRKRARRTTRKEDMPLSDEELLALRMWAALSPDLLPGEESQVEEEEEDMEVEGGKEDKKESKAKQQPTEGDSSDESSVEEDSKQPASVTVKEDKKQSAKINKGSNENIEQSKSEEIMEMETTATKEKTEISSPTVVETDSHAKVPSTAQGGLLSPEECSEADSDAAAPSQGSKCIIL